MLFDHFQLTLIHGPNIPSYAMLFFTALDLTFTTRHIHTGCCFCFSSVYSFFLELFLCSSPAAYWTPINLGGGGGVHLSVLYLFASSCVHGILKARILKWFAIPFSMDHILSEFSTMTRPSWVALHGMAYSFIEPFFVLLFYILE